jgi:hypothetical protein
MRPSFRRPNPHSRALAGAGREAVRCHVWPGRHVRIYGTLRYLQDLYTWGLGVEGGLGGGLGGWGVVERLAVSPESPLHRARALYAKRHLNVVTDKRTADDAANTAQLLVTALSLLQPGPALSLVSHCLLSTPFLPLNSCSITIAHAQDPRRATRGTEWQEWRRRSKASNRPSATSSTGLCVAHRLCFSVLCQLQYVGEALTDCSTPIGDALRPPPVRGILLYGPPGVFRFVETSDHTLTGSQVVAKPFSQPVWLRRSAPTRLRCTRAIWRAARCASLLIKTQMTALSEDQWRRKQIDRSQINSHRCQVGAAEEYLHGVCLEAQRRAPCIVVLDEMQAIFPPRESGCDSHSTVCACVCVCVCVCVIGIT